MITSPDHPLAEKDSVTIDEIRGYPLVCLMDNYGITTSVIKALESSGLSLKDFKIGCTVDDYFTFLNLVSAETKSHSSNVFYNSLQSL
jgi:DNA-binding transcriptional LysR family regulator